MEESYISIDYTQPNFIPSLFGNHLNNLNDISEEMFDEKMFDEKMFDGKVFDEKSLFSEINFLTESLKKDNTLSEVSDQFVKILADDTSTFTSYRVANTMALSFIPLPIDMVAHLKLLRAFSVLKEKVTRGIIDEDSSKRWQVYVTNSVRRFIIFISAARKSLKVESDFDHDEVAICVRDSQKGHIMARNIRKQLPPLDILMVWHAFSLSSTAYYDFLVRNQFCQFYYIPFPLDQINLAIDNTTFEYKPEKSLKDAYVQLISKFSKVARDSEYDSMHDVRKMMCDVKCPICLGLLLVGVNYTNEAQTGFADPGFKQPKSNIEKGGCPCNFSSVITHENLRRRQLYADLFKQKPLPNTYKYYSRIYKNDAYEKELGLKTVFNLRLHIKGEIERYLTEYNLELSINLSLASPDYKHAKLKILRHYFQMNLIHLTVKDGLEVLEDLVGTVMKQERFWLKINQIDWLHSPVVQYSLMEASERYIRFLGLLTKFENRGFMVPTLDIDLVWHTHQLCQKKYLADTVQATNGFVIDHDEKVEEGFLDWAFERTNKVWRKAFNDDYTFCPCWYCKNLRERSRSKLSWLTTSKNREVNLYLMPQLGQLTHISLHDTIQMPFSNAVRLRFDQSKKYMKKGILPWDHDNSTLSYGLYPHLFVVSPLSPFNRNSHRYYANRVHSEKLYGDLHRATIRPERRRGSYSGGGSDSGCFVISVGDSGGGGGGGGGDGGGCGGDGGGGGGGDGGC